MLIKDINDYNLTYKSIVNKFNLYYINNKPNENNKEVENQYIVVKHHPFTFIIFFDNEIKKNNCYCHELKEFIKPYKFLFLFSSSTDINQFKQIVNNIFKNYGYNEFQFAKPTAKNEAIRKFYNVHTKKNKKGNPLKNPNYSEDINNILKSNSEFTKQKIKLYNYNKRLKPKFLTNNLVFTKTNYFYQFNNIEGFSFVPKNTQDVQSDNINFFCNPNLFLEESNINDLNIISNNKNFNLFDITILKPLKKNINLYFNINNSKDLYFILTFIINYYNFAINKYYIYINHDNKYYATIYFHSNKSEPDEKFTQFFTSLHKKYFSDYFNIIQEFISEYAFNEFNFDWNLTLNKNSATHNLKMYLKKQLIIIFIQAFYDFFLTKSKIHFYPYTYNKETQTYDLTQLFP